VKVSTYKCDQCGIQKGETNHWWLLFSDIEVTKVGNRQELFRSGVLIVPWDAVSADHDDAKHICSQGCASKEVSQWMERNSPKRKVLEPTIEEYPEQGIVYADAR
jgi:hypothetical protein